MSCNGCRVLRKGCSQHCALRSCLLWIDSPEAQSHATLFLAKFFGRTDLMSFISSVPHTTRPALFQSLLYEACGRTVNPVSGAVGLLWSGNWHVCQAAAETILAGGVLRPLPEAFGGILQPIFDESSSDTVSDIGRSVRSQFRPFMQDLTEMDRKSTFDLSLLPESYDDVIPGNVGTALRRQTNPAESEGRSYGSCGDEKNKLLNLFV